MEGRNRSGNHSGSVVKNRSSSGCLIIKKHHGVSGVGSSKGPKLHESKKEKKRPRLNTTNSVSSDEELLEYNHRRGVTGTNRAGGGSLVYESNDFDDMSFGRNELMREIGPNRSQLDIYDFDEYDDLSDVDMMRTSQFYDRGMGSGERRFLNPMPGMNNCSGLDFEGGSSKGDIIYKRRNSFRGGSSSEKAKVSNVYSSKRRFEMRNELPVSTGKEKLGSDEAIRLQGKNGVLKVRVKHKEEISEHLSQNYRQLKGNNVAPRLQELTAKHTVVRPLPLAEKNFPKKPMAVDRLDKNRPKKRKPVAAKSSEKSDEDGEDSDSPPKLQVQRSTKRERNGGSMQSPLTVQPVKAKEGKVKRGSGTEKQLLREKIRSMLISAGWTIDYRPRRGRDYFDAVYVNPTGTAYWSIIKAYDALQKQLEEEGKSIAGDADSSFAPISEDVLSKLTRQTRKKIEKELKRKKREEAGGKRKKEFTNGSFEGDESDTDSGGSGKHDDKLSSFMKRSVKSLKGASKESCREGSYSNSKMQERNHRNSSTPNSRFTHAKKSKKIGRCTLLVRNSKKGMDSESDGFIPYTGKRNLLSWLIDSGTVKLSEKVHYMNRRCTRVMLEGWITREGIHCGCCSKILTVSKFEIHAASKLRQPYQNIYLCSGASLMQCQVDAWNKQEESLRNGYNCIDVNGDDPNDDTCAICGDGGNLICCDSCPSTFHQNCLGIEMLPAGDWHCPHCSCRFCGLADMSITKGNDRRLDSVLTCSFCEGKFHCLCVEEMDDTPINSNSPLFCGKTCQELYECLQKLLGVKHELEAGLCWSLVHRTDVGSDNSVRAYPQKVEWNSKLAVALNVMDECFLPIIDRRSGINMIHSVLYNSGSNISRLDYSGFYTAILEKGDEIVAAASIRVRSTEFAEMPFIGTRHIYRRQGMCRRLFSAIESALRSLKVEKLIIPAISELMDTWTTVFGFSSLQESDKQDIKIRNMLVFPGTDMLLKKLLDQDSAETDLAGANAYQNDHNASFKTDLRKQSDLQSSPKLCNGAAEPEDKEMKDITVTVVASRDTVCTDENLLRKTSVKCCEEVNPSLPAENEEINDKSVADLGSQDMVCTDENFLHSASADCREDVRTSLPTASPHDYNDNEPSLRNAFGSVSNELEPLISNEGDRETTSSELLLDTKFNDTSGPIKDHISADASVGNCDTGNSLDDSAERHYIDVSGDAELTQGTNVCVTDTISPPAGGSVPAASVNDMLNGFTKDDNEVRRDGMSYSNDGPATYGKDHSLLEASHPNVVIEKPMIESTADGCSRHPPEVEVDDANVVLDVCSGSQSLHVCDINDEYEVHEPKIHVSQNADAYGKDHYLLEASHIDVEMSKPSAEENICLSPVKVDNACIIVAETDGCSGSQPLHFPDTTNETASEPNIHVLRMDREMSKPSAEDSIYRSSEVEVDDADTILAKTNVCSGSQTLNFPDKTDLDTACEINIHALRDDGESSQITEARKALPGKDHFSHELSHVELVKPPAGVRTCQSPEVGVDDSDIVQAGNNVCLGSQSLYFPDNIDSDTACEPYIYFSGNIVECSQIAQAREGLPVDDGACEAPPNASDGTVAAEKPRSNLCAEQPTLEGEVQRVEAANVQPGSSFTYEVSVDTVDLRAQSSEDPPPISNNNNGGVGVMGLLRVSELHD